jgi:hypothetical protein
MLSNCANALCSAPLRRLAEGELFRLGTDLALGSSKACRVEYFWLCHRCYSHRVRCTPKFAKSATVFFFSAL